MERIESYSDFRIFLRDYYLDRKRSSKAFSHRQFCKKAGLSSPSYLKELIDGKRNLTEAALTSFTKALDLTERDQSFFMALVRFNQASDPISKQPFLEILRSLRQSIDVEVVPLDRYEYYSNWYLPVLRELATQRDWDEDWAALARSVRPRIRKPEAREGIAILERLGFIKRAGKRWIQTAPDISNIGEIISLAVRAGNKEFARLGWESIEQIAPESRDVSTMIIGMPSDAFPMLKQEFRAFKDRLVRIAQDFKQREDSVYAVNLQLFPLSQDPQDPPR